MGQNVSITLTLSALTLQYYVVNDRLNIVRYFHYHRTSDHHIEEDENVSIISRSKKSKVGIEDGMVKRESTTRLAKRHKLNIR